MDWHQDTIALARKLMVWAEHGGQATHEDRTALGASIGPRDRASARLTAEVWEMTLAFLQISATIMPEFGMNML